MSILLIVVGFFVAAVVLCRLTWSSLWGERRSLNLHKRVMDVLGSLPARQPRPRDEIGGRDSDQVTSSVSHPRWPEEAVVGDYVEATGTEQDVRRFDASGAEVGASVEMSNSPLPRSEALDPTKVWEAVVGNEVTGPAKRRRSSRRVASGLLGFLLISNKTRARPRGWTPLLAGALAVLALSAISGTLIASLMTSSTKRPAPITTPPPRVATGVVSATRDVWLKTGPGRAFGNIVIMPAGAEGEVACYDPNGQVETSTDGTSSTTWWRTYDGQNVGWVSGDYLNTQGARSAPLC